MNTQTTNRRAWLQATGRWAALGTLGLLTGTLLVRRSAATGCTRAPSCRDCPPEIRRLCRLPQSTPPAPARATRPTPPVH